MFKIKTFLLVMSCLFLSAWQIQRYNYKYNWQILQQQSRKKAPLKILPNRLDKSYEGRKFSITGKFDDEKAFLRDNSYFKKQRGFLLYLSLLHNNNRYIAKIGWVPNKSYSISKKSTIKGQIYCPKGTEFYLKEIVPENGWPKVIQTFDINKVADILNEDLGQCLLEVESNNFIPKHKTLSPNRHLGYAIQWFTFAVIILFIGIKNE